MSRAGMYEGKHYTEWVGTVKARKRTGDVDGAESLLHHLVDALEDESRAKQWRPPPWYYGQLAIIARKRKDYAAEIAILERHDRLARQFGDEVGFAERLRKVRTLKNAAESRPIAACPSCGATLEAMPAHSRDCPECGERIVVRRAGGVTQLLSLAQDRARTALAAADSKREVALRQANRIGTSDAESLSGSVPWRLETSGSLPATRSGPSRTTGPSCWLRLANGPSVQLSIGRWRTSRSRKGGTGGRWRGLQSNQRSGQ